MPFAINDPILRGPAPIELEGCSGSLYWVHRPFPFTDNTVVDDRLSGYPLAVFQPPHRPPEQTPVVLGLQGMAAPYQWNGFLVPTLLHMGIACVLFDTPLAGERSLARTHNGDILSEVAPLLEQGVSPQHDFVARLLDATAQDFSTVLAVIAERHGLTNDWRALFGVSLGALLSAYAFTRDGIGVRLLGAIGHADLRLFARSYLPALVPWLVSWPMRPLGRALAWAMGKPRLRAGLGFLTVVNLLRFDDPKNNLNPMQYLDRVGVGRRVRFLVGQDDPLVHPDDAVACARRFPDGECYVVPGLAHGGGAFVEHVRYFLHTQLGDWS